MNLVVCALTLLGIEHIPEQAEPLVEKRVVHGRVGNGRLRQSFSTTFGVNTVFGVDIHRLSICHNVAVLVATGVGAVLNLDLRIGRQQGARTVVHFIAQEVFVNVGIEKVLVAFIDGLLLRSGNGGWRDSTAVVHHGHGRTDSRARNHGNVGHTDVAYVVHVGDKSDCDCSARLPQ